MKSDGDYAFIFDNQINYRLVTITL
jgi:hypothetical protein